MVQPKQLKKLARERMERTGESYTTARKNILDKKPERKVAPTAPGELKGRAARFAGASKAPAAPAAEPEDQDEEELPEYPAPDEVIQYDAALWHRVLTQAGVTHPITGEPLSEAMLAGLAGGIGFMVFTFEYEQLTTATIVTRAHPEPYTANLLARCGASVNTRTTGSAQRAASYLDSGLDAGRAVVVRVAIAALPWIDAAQVEQSDAIDVAVVGEHGDDLLIDDGSGSLIPINPEDLSAARARLKKEKNWQTWIPTSKSPDAQLLADNVRTAVAETTGRLLGTTELQGVPAHFARNFGVAGMHSWIERLRDTTTKKGWSTIFADPQRLRAGLEQLLGFLTDTRYGGLGALRGLYADFLDEAALLPGLEALAEHSADYARLAEQWIELTDLVDPETDPQERSALFARLADKMQIIAEAEEQAAARLAAAVGLPEKDR